VNIDISVNCSCVDTRWH